MIKTQFLTPNIYYKESRDFQLFGRIFDVLFNYVKNEIDLIRTFPTSNTQDVVFIELLLRTLGFKNTGEYDIEQLHAISKVWMEIIRNKGSKKSIELAVRTILRVNNIASNYKVDINSVKDENEKYMYSNIVIQINESISSQESVLLEEILNYITPIGVTYVIQYVRILDDFPTMVINLQENLNAKNVDRTQLSSIAKEEGETITESDLTKVTNGHTGDFTNQEEHNLSVGSIKVGALAKKKETE